jgi:hypothetical protein
MRSCMPVAMKAARMHKPKSNTQVLPVHVNVISAPVYLRRPEFDEMNDRRLKTVTVLVFFETHYGVENAGVDFQSINRGFIC